MKNMLSAKEFSRQTNMLNKAKYKCKCGHRIIIPLWVDKQICDWCGKYVFREKKDEFKYRLKEKMR